jgi:hypothetical protein
MSFMHKVNVVRHTVNAHPVNRALRCHCFAKLLDFREPISNFTVAAQAKAGRRNSRGGLCCNVTMAKRAVKSESHLIVHMLFVRERDGLVGAFIVAKHNRPAKPRRNNERKQQPCHNKPYQAAPTEHAKLDKVAARGFPRLKIAWNQYPIPWLIEINGPEIAQYPGAVNHLYQEVHCQQYGDNRSRIKYQARFLPCIADVTACVKRRYEIMPDQHIGGKQNNEQYDKPKVP